MVWIAAFALLAQDAPIVRVPIPPPIRTGPLIRKQLVIPRLPDNEQTVAWGEQGNWHIRVDLTLNGGCFASVTLDDHSYVRIAFDPNSRDIAIFVGNAYWRSLQAGATQPLSLSINFDDPWEGGGTVRKMGNVTYIGLLLNRDFMTEAKQALVLTAESDNRHLGHYDIRGISEAFSELANCQENVEKIVDPFAR